MPRGLVSSPRRPSLSHLSAQIPAGTSIRLGHQCVWAQPVNAPGQLHAQDRADAGPSVGVGPPGHYPSRADGPWLLCIGPDVTALAERLALTGFQTVSVSDHTFDQLLASLSVLEHLVALPGCVGLWLDLGVGSASWRAALLRSVPQSVLAALLITAPLGLAVREFAPHVAPVRVPPAWLPHRGPLWLYSQHPVVLACAPALPGDLPSFVATLFCPAARFAPGVGGGPEFASANNNSKVGDSAAEAVRRYFNFVSSTPYSREALGHAATLGSALLEATNGWKAATQILREEGQQKKRGPLRWPP
jgi:hypothetical protein